MEKPTITYDDFDKVDIRVGKIIEVRDFPAARKPAYQLSVDFGPIGIKHSSAQITKHYTKENLVGRHVIAVVNFPKKQIANFYSEVLVLGVMNSADDIVLLGPDRVVELGKVIG